MLEGGEVGQMLTNTNFVNWLESCVLCITGIPEKFINIIIIISVKTPFEGVLVKCLPAMISNILYHVFSS